MVTFFWADDEGWWWQYGDAPAHGPYESYEQVIYRWQNIYRRERPEAPKLKVV